MKKSFRQLLQESFKSNDTEEWLDIYFTRPVGLAIALLCERTGITPNTVTLIGIITGAVGGWMFHYTDLWHNAAGVALLMFANFCDSADGQLARLTGNKTLVGRMLDGFASDVWFFCVYVAIVARIWNDPIPFTAGQATWQWWALLLCCYAGLRCHSTQCSLADYYRQIHLWFIKGDAGSELDSYQKEQQLYDRLKTQGFSWDRVFHYFYKGYCHKQERQTPHFQQFFAAYKAKQSEPVAQQFIQGSRPLMKYTNILTHNTRAFALFVAALINIPYLYPLFEIVVLQPLYWYMRHRHETLSTHMAGQLA